MMEVAERQSKTGQGQENGDPGTSAAATVVTSKKAFARDGWSQRGVMCGTRRCVEIEGRSERGRGRAPQRGSESGCSAFNDLQKGPTCVFRQPTRGWN